MIRALENIAAGIRVAAIALVAAVALCGCSREPDRTTPEGTIRAARTAVEKGQARRLGTYIYADNEDMRRLMNRFGVFLGNIATLGDSLQTAFPKEVGAMRAKAEAAAKEGKATSLLAQISAQVMPAGGKRKRLDLDAKDDAQAAFDEAIKSLFADPYGWLRESESRLTTTYLTDDSVALLWDGKPVFPPIGMTMKRGADSNWYFMLPTNLPGVSNVMPRTKEQYQIFGSLITVFDNVILDLTKDVKAGRLRSLDDVSRKAGEKTFIPAAMTVLAYSKLTESQKKEAKAAAAAQPEPK